MKNHLQTENDAALESPFLQLSSDGWGISKGFQKKMVGDRSSGKTFSQSSKRKKGVMYKVNSREGL